MNEEPEDLVQQQMLQIVTTHQGCKATELAALMSARGIEAGLIEDTLALLIKEQKLIEIEYVLPDMSYRVKSFLLPAGTKIYNNGIPRD